MRSPYALTEAQARRILEGESAADVAIALRTFVQARDQFEGRHLKWRQAKLGIEGAIVDLGVGRIDAAVRKLKQAAIDLGPSLVTGPELRQFLARAQALGEPPRRRLTLRACSER